MSSSSLRETPLGHGEEQFGYLWATLTLNPRRGSMDSPGFRVLYSCAGTAVWAPWAQPEVSWNLGLCTMFVCLVLPQSWIKTTAVIIPATLIAASSMCTNYTSGFINCKLTYKEVGRNPLNLPSIFQRRSGPRVWINQTQRRHCVRVAPAQVSAGPAPSSSISTFVVNDFRPRRPSLWRDGYTLACAPFHAPLGGGWPRPRPACFEPPPSYAGGFYCFSGFAV